MGILSHFANPEGIPENNTIDFVPLSCLWVVVMVDSNFLLYTEMNFQISYNEQV